MKKFLIKLLLVTFLFTLPVFSEGSEAMAGEETQLPETVQTGSPALLQSITIGVGRRRNRRWRRRAWRRNRRWHNRSRRRWHRRNRGARLELRGGIRSN